MNLKKRILIKKFKKEGNFFFKLRIRIQIKAVRIRITGIDHLKKINLGF